MNTDAMRDFCKSCAKRSSCTLRMDDDMWETCTLLQDKVPLSFHNSEGYCDPTSYQALRNIERDKHKSQLSSAKKRFDTQVAYYD